MVDCASCSTDNQFDYVYVESVDYKNTGGNCPDCMDCDLINVEQYFPKSGKQDAAKTAVDPTDYFVADRRFNERHNAQMNEEHLDSRRVPQAPGQRSHQRGVVGVPRLAPMTRHHLDIRQVSSINAGNDRIAH